MKEILAWSLIVATIFMTMMALGGATIVHH